MIFDSRILDAANDHLLETLLQGKSQSAIRSKISSALADLYRKSDYYPWILDIWDADVVFMLGSAYYQCSYTVSGDTVTLGTPFEVVAAYIQASAKESSEDIPVSELVPLRESALNGDGTGLLHLIQPGQGSSGYYPKETLRKAATAKVFPKGTQMFMDHQTESEEVQRPEGSLRNLMGVLEGDAEYREDGPDGSGLYAPVRVYSDYVQFVNERHKDIGNSINARGRSRVGQVAGKPTKIIEELVVAKSVDFVTRAGAGGKLVPLFESYRQQTQQGAAEGHPPIQENAMTKEEQDRMDLLSKENSTLSTQVAALRESVVKSEARDTVTELLAAPEVKLSEAAKKRVAARVLRFPIPTKDGALDKDAMATLVKGEIADATALITESGTGNPTSPVREMGTGTPSPATQPATNVVKEAQSDLDKTVRRLAGLPDKEDK